MEEIRKTIYYLYKSMKEKNYFDGLFYSSDVIDGKLRIILDATIFGTKEEHHLSDSKINVTDKNSEYELCFFYTPLKSIIDDYAAYTGSHSETNNLFFKRLSKAIILFDKQGVLKNIQNTFNNDSDRTRK